MAGLFVPLNVNYYEDDKIIGVGPMAELLYVRALAFAKRTGSDGRINANQLRAVSPRLVNTRRLVDRLVDAGLWERNGSGWTIPAFLAHNRPAAEIRDAKSVAGSLGNHRRWHTGKTGTPKVDCPFCITEGLIR